MKLSGAQILLQCLKELNVDTIFGYPGGAVLPIYDCLYYEKEIKHIMTAHEQWATHAADGYARVSGEPGVVLTTSGPGATNTITGIATAYSDSIPLVAITGQVPTAFLGKSAFQEMDICSIAEPITKKTFLIDDVTKIAEVLEEAFFLSQHGRPGPVLVDFPKDIQIHETEYEIGYVKKLRAKRFESNDSSKHKISDELCKSIEKAAEAINNGLRPMIYAGGGVIISGAEAELLEFAEKIKSPVTCSLMGLGAFPGEHKYYTGLAGMHGTKSSNMGITQSDVLIAIGARFSDRVTGKTSSFAEGATIIHIDIDEKELGKNVGTHIPINGDVKCVLKKLNSLIEEKEENSWNDCITNWKENSPLQYKNNGDLPGQFVIEQLYNVTNGEAIITTEVGQNQIWSAQFYKFKDSRHFVSSGGIGTMGYGLGAAIGASFAGANKKIINIAGDGSFKMNSQELSTVSKYKIPMMQLVLNNSVLGMVYQWQNLFYDGRYSFTQFGEDVNFERLTAAYGIKYLKITTKEETAAKLKEAYEYDGPVLVECVILPEHMVYPIVPPGESIENMIES